MLDHITLTVRDVASARADGHPIEACCHTPPVAKNAKAKRPAKASRAKRGNKR